MSHSLQAFQGIVRVYGQKNFDRFQRSRALVVGLGGVGSWVAEGLVRSGLGAITLMDCDDICQSNINRQIHALQSTVGQSKIEVLGRRLLDINPELKLDLVHDFLNPESREATFSSPYQVVIDCIDQTRNKVEVALGCRDKGIPLIAMGAAGGLRDPLKLKVTDLRDSHEDTLLSSLRKTLRVKHGFARAPDKMKIQTIFSTEKRVYPNEDLEVQEQKPTDLAGSLDCTGRLGSSVAVTCSFGMHGVACALGSLLNSE